MSPQQHSRHRTSADRAPATRVSLATLLTATAVLAGCARTTPAPLQSPSATPTPSTSTPTPHKPANQAPTTSRQKETPAPLPARGRLQLTPVTSVRRTSPAALVKPACPMPRSLIGDTPWSPAGNPKVAWPAERRLKRGTNHAPVADSYAHPAKQVVGWMTHKIPQPKGKIAFLTFDDGPNGVTTPAILKTLREEKVPATFFLVTGNVNDTTAPIVREQVAEGHAVAIHSHGHHYGYLYPGRTGSAANIGCDLDWATATLTAVLGKGYRTTAYRYPGGHNSWHGLGPADAMLSRRGITFVDWNSMSGDADATVPHRNAADMVANVPRTARMSGARQGDVLVVLMHDFHPNHLTPGSLRPIIRDLKKRGYTFGVIS